LKRKESSRVKQKALKYFTSSGNCITDVIKEEELGEVIRSYYQDALNGDKRAKRYFAQLKPKKSLDVKPPETFSDISQFLSELMICVSNNTLDIAMFKSLLEASQFKADLLSREENIELILEKSEKIKK